MIYFFFPLFDLLVTGAASGFMVHRKAVGKAAPDVFSCQLLFRRKEEFAGNTLQNKGNRRNRLHLHQ